MRATAVGEAWRPLVIAGGGVGGVAKRLGVADSTVWRWGTGRCGVGARRAGMIRLLCAELGCDCPVGAVDRWESVREELEKLWCEVEAMRLREKRGV